MALLDQERTGPTSLLVIDMREPGWDVGPTGAAVDWGCVCVGREGGRGGGLGPSLGS